MKTLVYEVHRGRKYMGVIHVFVHDSGRVSASYTNQNTSVVDLVRAIPGNGTLKTGFMIGIMPIELDVDAKGIIDVMVPERSGISVVRQQYLR
jgi:hypothetical protein